MGARAGEDSVAGFGDQDVVLDTRSGPTGQTNIATSNRPERSAHLEYCPSTPRAALSRGSEAQETQRNVGVAVAAWVSGAEIASGCSGPCGPPSTVMPISLNFACTHKGSGSP